MQRSLAILLVAALFAGSCGGGTGSGETDTPTAQLQPSSTTSLATLGTTTAAPTTTHAATATTVAEPTTTVPATTTSEVVEVLDLLYISDSGGWGVATLYGKLAADALGVEVNVENRAEGNLSAATVLKRIRGEASTDWSDLVRDADIIVVYGNPLGSGVEKSMNTCVSTSTRDREPPDDFTADDWKPYRDVLGQIYSEIWRLRDGQPTVLRAVDLYNPVISDWREAGIETECSSAWESWSEAIRAAADDGGATMVSLYDLFNGLDHDEDPRLRGYIGSDGQHVTPDGAAAIADALAAAGFEPTPQP